MGKKVRDLQSNMKSELVGSYAFEDFPIDENIVNLTNSVRSVDRGRYEQTLGDPDHAQLCLRKVCRMCIGYLDQVAQTIKSQGGVVEFISSFSS